MGADPNDAVAAFSEYAVATLWVPSHLTQLAGVTLIVVALVWLSACMAPGSARLWAALGSAIAVTSLAVTAALQAVDRIALKAMIDRWAAAVEPDKALLFHATVAVRQVEIGLASLTSLLFGAAVVIYAIGLLVHPDFGHWLAWLGLISGVSLMVAGVVMAHMGFSRLAMGISMPASIVVLLWVVALGIRIWHLPAGEKRAA